MHYCHFLFIPFPFSLFPFLLRFFFPLPFLSLLNLLPLYFLSCLTFFFHFNSFKFSFHSLLLWVGSECLSLRFFEVSMFRSEKIFAIMTIISFSSLFTPICHFVSNTKSERYILRNMAVINLLDPRRKSSLFQKLIKVLRTLLVKPLFLRRLPLSFFLVFFFLFPPPHLFVHVFSSVHIPSWYY